MGSNPVESPEFFSFMGQLLKLSSKCEDHVFISEFIFPCLASRVKMSLSRAQNIFMSKNINYIVIIVSREQFYSGLHSAGRSYSTN